MISEEKWKDVENKTLEDILSEQFFGEDGPKAKRMNSKDGELFVLYSPDFTRAILFQAKEEDIRAGIANAENYFKYHGNYLSEDKFFEFLGFVADPAKSENLCWNKENEFKVHIGSVDVFGGWLNAVVYDTKPVRPDLKKTIIMQTPKQKAGGKMV